MPLRIIPFVNDSIYHIYNRGNEKRPIFHTRRDYSRFIKAAQYYQLEGPKPKFSNFSKGGLFKPSLDKKIVAILCFCIMPNHFHFMVRQLKDGGVVEFIRKLSDSYTKYYNIKHERVGPLLQGRFKAVLVESDEQFIHLSRYIHLNPLVSFLIKDLKQYEWSSYNEYIKNSNGICSKEDILGFFKTSKKYEQFVLDQIDYGKQLELLKHKIIEEI